MAQLTKKQFQQWLVNRDACEEAVEWVGKQKSAKDALAKCKRLDWLQWLAFEWPTETAPRIRYARLEQGLAEFFTGLNTPKDDKRHFAMLVEGLKRIYEWEVVREFVLAQLSE